MVTGGSVVALKYAGGVLIATDTLASYGSLARFEGVQRMAAVGRLARGEEGLEYIARLLRAPPSPSRRLSPL